jgi:hypothetical protein
VLIPSLIEGHVHLASVPGMTPLMEMRYAEIADAYRALIERTTPSHNFEPCCTFATREARNSTHAARLKSDSSMARSGSNGAVLASRK